MKFILVYYLAISLCLFIMMCWDKISAIRGWRRIPEKRLLRLGALGGCFGGLLGMLIARHKIRKPVFWLDNIASIILHTAVLFYLYRVVFS